MSSGPYVTPETKEEYLRKLEPHLKKGFSINKACLEAQIPSSTIYDIMDQDEVFAGKITLFKQFLSILMGNMMTKQLMDIYEKQKKDERLTRDEVEFLKWYALNSNLTKEEFGERKTVSGFDPEAELKRIRDIAESKGTKVVFTEEEMGHEVAEEDVKLE